MLPREIAVGRQTHSSGFVITVTFGSWTSIVGTDPNRTCLIISSNSNNDWFVRLGVSNDNSPVFCQKAGGNPIVLRIEDVGNEIQHEVQVFCAIANADFGVCQAAYHGETES